MSDFRVALSRVPSQLKSRSNSELPPINETEMKYHKDNSYDIDSVGKDCFNVSQFYILQKRSTSVGKIMSKRLIPIAQSSLDLEKNLSNISKSIEKQIITERRNGKKDKMKFLYPYFSRAITYEKLKQVC